MKKGAGDNEIGIEGNPCIEITPTPEQYVQLCRDLAKLRSLGAPSNTAAIIEAVSDAATSRRIGARPRKRTEGRLPTPRSSNRR